MKIEIVLFLLFNSFQFHHFTYSFYKDGVPIIINNIYITGQVRNPGIAL